MAYASGCGMCDKKHKFEGCVASIMAPATPFYFWTTQKHITVERTIDSMT